MLDTHTAPVQLLCLPGELRQNIYEYALSNEHCLVHPINATPYLLQSRSFSPPLLRVSRQLYDEGYRTFYAMNAFVFTLSPSNPFDHHIPQLPWITRLSIFFNARLPPDNAEPSPLQTVIDTIQKIRLRDNGGSEIPPVPIQQLKCLKLRMPLRYANNPRVYQRLTDMLAEDQNAKLRLILQLYDVHTALTDMLAGRPDSQIIESVLGSIGGGRRWARASRRNGRSLEVRAILGAGDMRNVEGDDMMDDVGWAKYNVPEKLRLTKDGDDASGGQRGEKYDVGFLWEK